MGEAGALLVTLLLGMGIGIAVVAATASKSPSLQSSAVPPGHLPRLVQDSSPSSSSSPSYSIEEVPKLLGTSLHPSIPDAGQPTLSIPLGSNARRSSAYVVRLARGPNGWQAAGLEDTATRLLNDTLTLTLVLPWDELDARYQRLNIVLQPPHRR